MNPVRHITARDNPLLKELRKLGSDSVAYRKLGRVWVEGEHLCSAAIARGVRPRMAVFSDAGWARAAPELRDAAPDTVRLPDALFSSISALDSPSDMGFVMDLPLASRMLAGVNTVLLDRVQDAGNVGSMLLRSVCARCWRCAEPPPCVRPKCCAPAWVPISACIWLKVWSRRTSMHGMCPCS